MPINVWSLEDFSISSNNGPAMSNDSHNNNTRWRIAFIIAEALVVGWTLVSQFDPRTTIREYPLNPNVPMQVCNYGFYAAFLFLLIASPFFCRKLRLVAWSGWAIALAVLLYGLAVP
ncbi:MAG TPA: hypothetical protein VM680_17765 [Verrucomicrobiae bacterium]|nr:hypothetical protein [Verrucomicrobiae bacterium]